MYIFEKIEDMAIKLFIFDMQVFDFFILKFKFYIAYYIF